jgi:hypothetical protein
MLRYKTIPRDQGIEDGLAARVHDALWMLARQWQFGEFEAEDAASPAHIEVQGESHLLDGWRPAGSNEWQPYDRNAQPLERVIEQEPASGPDPRLRLEGGLRIRQLLERRGLEDGAAALARAHPFESKAPAVEPAGLAAAVRRRLADGAKLREPLGRLAADATRDAAADALAIPADRRADAAAAAVEWLQWWDARAPATTGAMHPEAWDEHRLEYAFELRAGGLPDTALVASGYAGGRLDWWGVDAKPVGASTPANAGQPVSVSGVPSPARFGGMPTARFWEMEDALFDPGAVDASPADLGRLLIVTFATVYGNDWFVAPIRLPAGSLTRIDSFALTDVFGRTSELGRAGAADDQWNLFGMTDVGQDREPGQERATVGWFFLPPTLPDSLESAPLETVILLRDEMANLAWAVESAVTDDGGGSVDRFAQWAARPQPGATDASTGLPRYRVQSDVPDHWYPLAPEPLGDQASIRLQLVPLQRGSEDGTLPPLPLGLLLRTARSGDPGAVWLHEEEVPRAGVAVARSRQFARWHDGSLHAWTARRKRPGGGEGSSGLRHDFIEPSA